MHSVKYATAHAKIVMGHHNKIALAAT
jgi:hypothetical protein